MKLGIFAKTFPGVSPHGVLKAVGEAGYGTAHFNLACAGLAAMPDSVPDDAVAEISSAVAESRISLCGLSATFNMIHPDPSQRTKGLRQLEVLARTAQTLSIPLLTLCTGSRDPDDQWRHHRDNQSVEAWTDLCRSMEKAIAIADAHGVDLGVEPELANVVNSPGAALQLLRDLQSDRIRIVIDPANLAEGATVREHTRITSKAVDQLAESIAMAHAKDRDESGQVVACGRGVIDFERYLQDLRSIDFAGPLVTHGLQAVDAAEVSLHLTRIAHTQGWSF